MVINFTKLNKYAQVPEQLKECNRSVFELRCAQHVKINPLEWQEVHTGLTMFLPPKCIARVHQHPEVFGKECMSSSQIFSQSDEIKVQIFNTRFPLEFLMNSNNKGGRGELKANAALFGSINCAEFELGDVIGLLTIEKTDDVSMKEVQV